MTRLWLPLGIGLFLILAFGVAGGLTAGYVMGILLILVVLAAHSWRSASDTASAQQGARWLAQFPGATYTFAHGAFGIVVDLRAESISLRTDGQSKTYPLADVRSWRTSLLSGGEIVYAGGGAMNAIAAGSANARQQRHNRENSGLFVSVRDVDHPEWRIVFSRNDAEEKRQQARWFEVLNQAVNKG